MKSITHRLYLLAAAAFLIALVVVSSFNPAGATAAVTTLADGTLAKPSLAFVSSPGTGVFYGGSNTFKVDANKTLVATVASTGITMGTGTAISVDNGTAAATAGAATLSKQSGVITSEAVTTAAQAAYTLTLTNTVVAATSRVTASVDNGTNTQGIPVVGIVTPGSGSVVIKVYNLHATQALNGTLKIAFNVSP
jgi:hypothetical protein